MKAKLALALVAYAVALLPSAQAQTKPNIVFILMDNLGYGEVRVYGAAVSSVAHQHLVLIDSRPKGCA
jgi:hypothetical protein